jgi:ABC-2 type transport system permease protein
MNAINLLKIEWLKFRKNSTVVVLLSSFTLLMPFIILAGKSFFKNVPPPLPSSSVFYEFPTVWDYQGYVGNWLVCFLLGYVIIHIYSTEVSNRTHRQTIINGYTKQEYWLSKMLVVIALSLAATLLYYVSSILLGLWHTSNVEIELIFDNNYAAPRFFLMSISYLSFALLMAIVIKRGMLALLIYFASVMIIEPLLRMLHVYYFKSRWSLFYPLNSTEDLMPNPFFKLPGMLMEQTWGFKIMLTYQEATLTTIIYLIIIVWLGRYLFLRKDL